ncbi:MAG: 16S rRNA (cytosine967-C5)-methyltransferase [Kiritimatiellia bacterium]|jgi:16S rRNA (cytosine967-C5)-methyltransferase
MQENPRAHAAEILYRWLENGQFVESAIDQADVDRGLIREIVLGSIRRKATLDWIINRYAKQPPDLQSRSWLMLGIYQLYFLDGVADYAAVNETTEAAKGAMDPYRVKFLHAILRNAGRDEEQVRKDLAAAAPNVRFSHPKRLLKRWTAQYGEEKLEALCAWNNSRAPVVLRLRKGASVESYLAELAAQDIAAHAHIACPDRAIVLDTNPGIRDLPGFGTGQFYIQDPSTFAAPDLVRAQPGETILDACAAPGGKTIMLAEAMNGKGILLANDVGGKRLTRIKQNLKRMQQEWVDTVQMDFTRPDEAVLKTLPAGGFDAILLDVPCSNTGVLRRRVEARWRFNEEEMKTLAYLQSRMLDEAATMIKPGGRIVYGTCSIEAEENEGRVAAFLDRVPGFTLEAEQHVFPGALDTEGGYAARLVSTPA